MDLKRWARLHWDRLLAWALVAGGAVALYVGWHGVADTPFPAEQMSYVVSGGIVGGLLIVLGGALLVSADLRDEWHKLDRIEALLREQGREPVGPTGEATPARASENGHAAEGPSAPAASGRRRLSARSGG
jgi:hypothetical protein